MPNDQITNQIDVLLREIPQAEYPIKGTNCLLPCDSSQDVKKLIYPLLIELKEHLKSKDYDSYKFGYFLTEKFEVALELKIFFPEEILAKLLKLFYSILFEMESSTYSVKKYASDLLTKLLKKSKKIDKKLFVADWKLVYGLIDNFYYTKHADCPGFHAYQTSTCENFIELAKHIKRFYPVEEFDSVLNEFEGDLIAQHSKEALRAVRYIALFLPLEDLKVEQVERVFNILSMTVGKFKRISSQFDIFIVYMLKKITKSNRQVLKSFDWELMSKFVFEQILPGALKIPSPVKGARKLSKLVTKSDVPLGEDFFEILGTSVPSRIAKWIVYTMQGEGYSVSIHKKLLFFLDSLRSLCHPSNYGAWSVQIELFLGYFAGTLAKQTNTDDLWLKESSGDLIDEVVGKIWNLSELLVFARSGAAMSGMCISTFTCTNLVNIRPELIVPKMMVAISGSLESVSEPHRTTSAIGLLQVTMPNLMKTPLGIRPVLSLLPTVVYGIDSNDQLKTVRTLSFFLSFTEAAAKIKDISGENFNCQMEWSDACQEAKELTGQFSDIFLVFTENIISYLRTVSQNSQDASEKGQDDLSRMILAIANCVYSHTSTEIAQICLEKWITLFDEDLGTMITEIVGEITSKLIKKHYESHFEKFIPKFMDKILFQIERGDGQLGSKDQSNNALNNNLIILSQLLENGKGFIIKHHQELEDFIIKLLNSMTNRRSFLAGSRLFHCIIINLIHYEIKEIPVELDCTKDDPFQLWARWVRAEELEIGKDFSIEIPSEFDGLLALKFMKNVLTWVQEEISKTLTLTGTLTKSASEKLYCLLQVIDNLNIDFWNINNSFGSFNYEINSELLNEKVIEEALKLEKENLEMLTSLAQLIETSGNLELEIQFIEIVSTVINGFSVHPEKPREKLKAIKRLNINYDRFHRDKHRPISFWILKAEAQFKLRRDLRFNFGDSRLERVLMENFKVLADVLFKFSFKPYHMLRASSQGGLRLFSYKYIDKARDYIIKTLELVESSDNISETEFKGFCFLIRSRFTDMICEDFGLLERYLRCLLKLNSMPIAEEVNDSFEILSGTLNVFSDAFVPDSRYDRIKVKTLVLDLIKIAEEKETEKWTSQYLAMLSAHPLIEICHVPEIFMVLARFSLSKVSVIRNIAQNCFKVAMFGHVKAVDPTFWNYRDLTPLDIVKSGKLCTKIPESHLKQWTETEFEEFSIFFREYLKFLCLNEENGEVSDGTLEFEYMNFVYIGRWINLFGPAEVSKFLKMIEDNFLVLGPLDLGKQRALTEIVCAIICNTSYCEADPLIVKLLLKSWNSLAIENLDLWIVAIDEVLMWKPAILKQILSFFESSTNSSNETSKIILSIKMVSIIVSRIGFVGNWINCDDLIGKLLKLCSHEYTSIVMESSKLLALISLRDGSKTDLILKGFFEADLNSLNVSRSILQFFACASTMPILSNYWKILSANLFELLKMLQSENVQLLTDAKKAMLTLFLAKGAELDDLKDLTQKIIKFVTETSRNLPVKISKFCVELVQLLLQNNFSLFNQSGTVENFFKTHVDALIESDQIHLREASHGICVTLYQINPEKSAQDIEKVTKNLLNLRNLIKNESKMRERHAAVIRGSAIILSEPHVISKPLPSLLTILSYYISDRSPISPLVRTTFSEFRRTHQDNWQVDRQLFDEDQLDAIGELLIAPSYYA